MISWLIPERRSYSQSFSLRDPEFAHWWGGISGANTESGVTVNEDTANSISAFWCGVNIIADAFKSLPCGLFTEIEGGGKQQIKEHAGIRLLKRQPNPETSPSRFKWLFPAWIITWGNFYAEIERDRTKEPMRAWPIHPSRVCPKRRGGTGSIYYEVYNENGTHVEIDAANMLHSFRHTRDGWRGIGVLGVARESLGMTVVAEQYGARFFGNSARPSTLLVVEDAPDVEAIANLRKSWQEMFGGNKSGGVGVIGGGTAVTKVETLTLTNEDSQFLESRVHQISEIARWLVISPYKLGEYGKMAYANVEQLSIDFGGQTIQPYALDAEEEFDRKLLTEADRDDDRFFEFKMSGLLRADMKARYDSYAVGLQNGFMVPDEARQLENLNPLPDGLGQIPTRPANMITAAELKAKADNPAAFIQQPQAPQEPHPQGRSVSLGNFSRERIDATFRDVFAEAARRLESFESDKMGKALKKPQEYPDWTRDFADEHAKRVRDNLAPLIAAYRESIGQPSNPGLIDAVVSEYQQRLYDWLRKADPAAGREAWIMERLK